MSGVFLYTVTAETDTETLREAYEAWLVGGHLEDVCDAGALSAECIRRGPTSMEARYEFASAEAFAAYERDHAPRLRAEGLRLFPSGVRFQRSTATLRASVTGRAPHVEVVPCWRDNYAYLLRASRGRSEGTSSAIAIDPTDADALLARLDATHTTLEAIWCTHHHADHVGGVPALLARFPGIPVLGSAYDLREGRIPGQTHGLVDGDELSAFGRTFRALAVPGHTLGAITFVGAGLAFTGDTLFLGGCGRVFEGTMAGMHASLARLAALEPETRLYVGHEYTEKNLEFALHVEPESRAVKERLDEVRRTRARGEPTVPATLRDERATNPFLRAHTDAVRAFATARAGRETSSDAEVFAEVRAAKDAF